MNGYIRIKSPWSQLGLFLALTGAGLVVTTVLLGVMMVGSGISAKDMQSGDLSNPAFLGTLKLVQAISSITIFLIPALVFALITFAGSSMQNLGIRRAVNSRMYLMAILCIVASIPFVLWLGDLNQSLPLPHWMVQMEEKAGKQMEQFLKAGNTSDIVLNVFIIALLPAVCEEIFFRGVLQRIVINICKTPWTGIIVTAIIFSTVHFQFLGFIPRTMLGIILGALYWYSGSIWTSILAHFFNNALQVVAISYFPVYLNKNPSMPPLVIIGSCLLFLAILWVYKSFSTITYNKIYRPQESGSRTEFSV